MVSDMHDIRRAMKRKEGEILRLVVVVGDILDDVCFLEIT